MFNSNTWYSGGRYPYNLKDVCYALQLMTHVAFASNYYIHRHLQHNSVEMNPIS